ncbi:galactosylceramide sulfotransferase-like [Saccoglossus kowalevskii]|uniref:Galactosylceramide sulfotransferase-like n=1 Tax=Saccoglossus kowalevskii TaxID=10224 RepID=A0ABM0MJ99_SACKO|nr:PREDICTED: galactosylceramide sulfotransferase-like [Saccoglossus kowalevskii]
MVVLEKLQRYGPRHKTLVRAMVLCFVIYSLYFLGFNETYQSIDEHSHEVAQNDAIVQRSKLMSAGNRVFNWKPKVTSDDTSSKCQPQRKLVYLRLVETKCYTFGNILNRFGYHNGLTFVLPDTSRSAVFDFTEPLSETMIAPFNTHDYDLLVHFARYNHLLMHQLVPNARFITMIQEPSRQLRASFFFFKMQYRWKLRENFESQTFPTFVRDASKYYYTNEPYNWLMKNGQLFMLGLDHKDELDADKVKQRIGEIEYHFDLVMINEYFDESLILLKKIMCWSFEDILYMPHDAFEHSYTGISSETTRTVDQWSAADRRLYYHFNTTFWRKVEEYGDTFQQDLQTFRLLNANAIRACATKNPPHLCTLMATEEEDFVEEIRNHQQQLYGFLP